MAVESQPRVLVVDDSPDGIQIIQTMLESHGYRISSTESGEHALVMAAEAAPDLIILDVVMPGMSGVEVLEKLRASPRTSRIPVILLTGKSQDEDVITGYQTGADYYITKPFTSKQLLYGIQLVLGASSAG